MANYTIILNCLKCGAVSAESVVLKPAFLLTENWISRKSHPLILVLILVLSSLFSSCIGLFKSEAGPFPESSMPYIAAAFIANGLT